MGGITFWVVALGIPSVTVGLNAVVHGVLRRPQTTGADFVLALIAFDAVVLADPGEFRQWVGFVPFRDALGAIFVVILFIGILAWIGLLLLERKFELRTRGRLTNLGYFWTLFFAFVLPAFVMFLNVMPFLYR
jgi:hypothetical protein